VRNTACRYIYIYIYMYVSQSVARIHSIAHYRMIESIYEKDGPVRLDGNISYNLKQLTWMNGPSVQDLICCCFEIADHEARDHTLSAHFHCSLLRNDFSESYPTERYHTWSHTSEYLCPQFPRTYFYYSISI
jgi:hypothetical protein